MESYSKQFFIESGRRGGQKTLKKWGKKHLRAIAAMGGRATKGISKKKKVDNPIDTPTP